MERKIIYIYIERETAIEIERERYLAFGYSLPFTKGKPRGQMTQMSFWGQQAEVV